MTSIEMLRALINCKLDEIRQMWRAESDVKLTLVVRVADLEDGDTVLTDEDDLELAVVAIRNLAARVERPSEASTLETPDDAHPGDPSRR